MHARSTKRLIVWFFKQSTEIETIDNLPSGYLLLVLGSQTNDCDFPRKRSEEKALSIEYNWSHQGPACDHANIKQRDQYDKNLIPGLKCLTCT